MQIGEKLKQKRNEAGLSQEVLAEKIGVSRQTISNWENNRSYPDIGSVLALSDLYGISLDELLKEDENMRKHVEETAKLPMKWWKILYGLTIALFPLSTLLSYWGAVPAALALKILGLLLLPVLAFIHWKLTGGQKRELFIMLFFWAIFLVSEIVTGIVNESFVGASGELFAFLGIFLIYSYGELLGKGLVFWLLIFLYFGAPIYIAVDSRLPGILSYEPASKAELYDTYVIGEVLYGSDLGYSQVTIDSYSEALTIDGEYVGLLRYTKPLENQKDIYAVWQLVPEDEPDTLYRLEVDREMRKTLSCIVDDQLQWKWLLGTLPEVKCVEGSWKEPIDGYNLPWYSAADPLDDVWAYPVIEPETLFIYWGDESATTLTVEETIGDGEPTIRILYRDENGNFPLGEVFPEPGVIHTYRIEYLGGAFILRVKFLQ